MPDEAASSEEERRKFTAEASLFHQQARKAAAEAVAAEHAAELAQINRDREVYKRSREEASDLYHHVYRFVGEVSAGSVKTCMDELILWSRLDPGCDIEIIFQSPGGDTVAGMALWDVLQDLRAHGHKLTTVARGYAASMAGILLQAGDVRVMGRESWLLIHEASFGVIGSFGEVEDRVEWVRKLQNRILDIFAARSNLSRAQIKRRWHRKDWWLDSEEALKLGFIDEIR